MLKISIFCFDIAIIELFSKLKYIDDSFFLFLNILIYNKSRLIKFENIFS